MFRSIDKGEYPPTNMNAAITLKTYLAASNPNNGDTICLSDDQAELIAETANENKTMSGLQFARHCDKEDFSTGDEFVLFSVNDASALTSFMDLIDETEAVVSRQSELAFRDVLSSMYDAEDALMQRTGRAFRGEFQFIHNAIRCIENQAREDELANRCVAVGITLAHYKAADAAFMFNRTDAQHSTIDSVCSWGFPVGFWESLNQ